MLLNIQIVNDAVIADATTPSGGLSFKTLYITQEGVLLHGEKSSSNARLIFWRKLSKVLLCGLGELEVPSHRGIFSMIANPHDERRLGRGAGQPVLPWWALRPDSLLRNMPRSEEHT